MLDTLEKLMRNLLRRSNGNITKRRGVYGQIQGCRSVTTGEGSTNWAIPQNSKSNLLLRKDCTARPILNVAWEIQLFWVKWLLQISDKYILRASFVCCFDLCQAFTVGTIFGGVCSFTCSSQRDLCLCVCCLRVKVTSIRNAKTEVWRNIRRFVPNFRL